MEDKENKSGYVKVKCHKCGCEAIVFGKSSTKVMCKGENCEEVIVVPRGGKAAINAEILELI